MPYSKRLTLKKALIIVLIAILPTFYLWFYDPKTSFDFYIMANTSSGIFLNLVKAIDFFNNIWIPIYLFFPVYLMYKFYRVTELDIKKKQVIALSICLLILNALFLVLLVTGPFKQIVFTSFSSSAVSFPDSIEIPLYYYDIMPIVMIIIVEFMLILVTKYNGFDTVDIFQEIIINRNVRGLNKNLRSIFHSFKNTIFSLKILAEQAKEDYGGAQGKVALDRIEQISNDQFNSMTWMLDSFKEITIVTESNRVVKVIEQALRKVGIGKNIKVIRNYVYPDVKSIFDAYHITEALYNIIQNAVEAIDNASQEQGVLKIDVSAEHEWVIIKITDNGTGIKKDQLKRIFKPFYTTKSRQNNWGVGLSYSYRVIKANLGFITVDSVPGQYTTFQILLPRADEEDVRNGEN
jgi:hypothetical protein